MKRLGILTLYDNHNEVDECTRKLINDLKPHLDYLFVVCNFAPEHEGRVFLDKISDYVLLRENTGFDGGAIKDAINILFSDKLDIFLQEYDELLIINDTFYGCINSLQPFFDWFRASDNDFAGLTKNEGGYLWMGRSVPAHVQGYVIIIKSRLFMDVHFLGFWRDFNYPSTYVDNIFNFEYGFSEYFYNHGLMFDAYYDLKKHGLTKPCDVDYMDHPYELMEYEKYPVFKYKAAWVEYMNDSSYKALLSIKRKSPEEFDHIMKHVMKSSDRMYIRQDRLTDFCKNKHGVYIYGYGELGKRIRNFIHLMGYSFKGFIISHTTSEMKKGAVSAINDIKLNRDEGIIVGMNKDNVFEIKEYLEENFASDQLFWPSFD